MRLLNLRRIKHYPAHVTRKVLANPSFLWKRLKDRIGSLFGLNRPDVVPQSTASDVLNLQAGERVRVKLLSQILATLDEEDQYKGMAFMIDEMAPYCGGTYTVRKRIERFFDERNYKLLNARDVVILDGVFCEPHPESKRPYAGCTRTCFLFWKEAWLERVDTIE